MYGNVFLMVILSTFMHAGWNLLARGQGQTTVFFDRMLRAVALLSFLPLVIGEVMSPAWPRVVWLYVALSGGFSGLYHYFLARAYSSADFTVVYPLARSIPVLILGVGDVARGRILPFEGWMGLIMVALGCSLAPQQSWSRISIRSYLNWGSLWMMICALGTVGYSLLDKVASEMVVPGPLTAARYEAAYFSFTYLAFGALTWLGGLWGSEKGDQKVCGLALLAGLMNFGAYWLILWAYQLAERVSYVFAFRQFGIILGVAVAFAVFHETGRTVRTAGSVLITAGLVIIGLFGED